MNLDDVIALALSNVVGDPFSFPDPVAGGYRDFGQRARQAGLGPGALSQGQMPASNFPIQPGRIPLPPEFRQFDQFQPPPQVASASAPPGRMPIPPSPRPMRMQPESQFPLGLEAPPPIQEPMPLVPPQGMLSPTPTLDALAMLRSGSMNPPPPAPGQELPLTALLQSLDGQMMNQGQYDEAQQLAEPETRRAASFLPISSALDVPVPPDPRQRLNQSFRDPNFGKYKKKGPNPDEVRKLAAYEAGTARWQAPTRGTPTELSSEDAARQQAYRGRVQADESQRRQNVTANAQARQKISELMRGFGLNRAQAQQASAFGDKAHEVALAISNPKAAQFLQTRSDAQAKQSLEERKAQAAEDMVLAELVEKQVLTPQQAQQRMAARNPTPSQAPQVSAPASNQFSDRFAAAKADPFFISATQNPMYHALNRIDQAEFEKPESAANIRAALQQQWGDNWQAEFENMVRELGGGQWDAEKVSRWRRTLLGTTGAPTASQSVPKRGPIDVTLQPFMQ